MPASTWILTGSPENYAVTRELGFSVVGIKERNRPRALAIEPGDQIVFYLTRVMSFAAIGRISGELFEDRELLWPGKPGKRDAYPWRFPMEPVLELSEDRWLAAASLTDQLEHIKKWPAEHWKLAFQGQLRTVSNADATLLAKRMRAAQKKQLAA